MKKIVMLLAAIIFAVSVFAQTDTAGINRLKRNSTQDSLYNRQLQNTPNNLNKLNQPHSPDNTAPVIPNPNISNPNFPNQNVPNQNNQGIPIPDQNKNKQYNLKNANPNEPDHNNPDLSNPVPDNHPPKDY